MSAQTHRAKMLTTLISHCLMQTMFPQTLGGRGYGAEQPVRDGQRRGHHNDRPAKLPRQ